MNWNFLSAFACKRLNILGYFETDKTLLFSCNNVACACARFMLLWLPQVESSLKAAYTECRFLSWYHHSCLISHQNIISQHLKIFFLNFAASLINPSGSFKIVFFNIDCFLLYISKRDSSFKLVNPKKGGKTLWILPLTPSIFPRQLPFLPSRSKWWMKYFPREGVG